MKSLSVWSGVATLICGIAAVAFGSGDDFRPDFDGAVGWLNSNNGNSRALRGRVVLVNFWTYSCINSLRELPYIKAWAAKYREAGLAVVGVHAPEFGFERVPANVQAAVSTLGITFPVAIDSDHAIWSAFRNEYWPADYLLDAKGKIRYRHFGEGDYESSERAIQALLRESGSAGVDESTVRPRDDGVEAQPSHDVRSPETYVGYARAENFTSRERVARDSQRLYNLPPALAINQWGFRGLWNVGAEKATLQSAPGRIAFRFHSRDLHMVLGPGRKRAPVRFRVKLNGAAPGNDHGVDSDVEGAGEIRQPRMYQLIRQKGPIQDMTFEIEFLDPGIEAFSFTFG